MVTANNIENRRRLNEPAGVQAAFVLGFSITTLRQVECHAR
jgi:hypothetical protein